MKGFLITLAILSFVGSVFLLPGTLASGLWFAPLALGAVLLAISRIIALLEEISMILRHGDRPAAPPAKSSAFSIGGVYYVADPPSDKPAPASADDADIWPDVTDPALRREIIRKAKDTGAAHVMVNGLTYKVEFKK